MQAARKSKQSVQSKPVTSLADALALTSRGEPIPVEAAIKFRIGMHSKPGDLCFDTINLVNHTCEIKHGYYICKIPGLDVAYLPITASVNGAEQRARAKLFVASRELLDAARFVASQCQAIASRVRAKDKHLSAASVAAILDNMAETCERAITATI